jgi:polysaccharide export outer membrane protein
LFADPTPRRFIAVFVALAAALLGLSGCADKPGGPIPYNVALGAPDQPSVASLESDYRISPMDTLAIKVFKSEELSGDYQVDLAGHISLPLVGEVAAADLTTAELDQKLTELLGQKYFEHPDVSVGVKESVRRTVTVDGAVKEGGAFPVPGPITLIQAVALAKGTSEDANAHRVAVFRTIGGKRQAAAFDLAAIRRGQGEDPQIYPGDIVVVDGSGIKEGFKRVLQSMPVLGLFNLIP